MLVWHFDDAPTNERDAQLERVQALQGWGMSQDAVAATLEAYAALVDIGSMSG